MIKPFLNILESDYPGDKAKELESMGFGIRYNNKFLPRINHILSVGFFWIKEASK